MRNISTAIEINASPERIWKTLVDFKSYKQWNPFITNIKGALKEGGKIHVEIVLEGGSPSTFTPKLLVVHEGKELRWVGRVLVDFLFRGEHWFVLIRREGGVTIFEHGETFSGILVPLLGGMLKKTESAFNLMNQALKNRVESADWQNYSDTIKQG